MAHTILWITSKWIVPADDGSRVASVSLLRSLTKLGVTVDLMALHGPNETPNYSDAVRELGVRNAFGVRRTRGNDTGAAKMLRLGRSFVTSPLTPITVAPYTDSRLCAAVEERLGAGYSHIVFEGVHTAGVYSKFGVFRRPAAGPRLIYRAQNCESTIWERTAELEPSAPKRAMLRFQTARMQALERSVLEGTDGVAAISCEDAEAFEKLSPASSVKSVVVPIGFDFQPPLSAPDGKELKVLFLGRLDWPPNRDGLKWFLREVWPGVAETRGNISLTIAGSGECGWLPEFMRAPRITFLGRVPEVAPLYRDNHLSLVPIFYGSGTRVKAVEAARYGRATLSTPMGVEGTGFRPGIEYLSAGNVAEWRTALGGTDPRTIAQTGIAAHTLAERNFSSVAVAARFVELLDRTIMDRTLNDRAAEESAGADRAVVGGIR